MFEEKLKIKEAHDKDILNFFWNADGSEFATVAQDKLIKIWNLNGRLIKSLSGHESTATVVCFHPHSKTIYSTSHDPYIMIWNKDYINTAIVNCP